MTRSSSFTNAILLIWLLSRISEAQQPIPIAELPSRVQQTSTTLRVAAAHTRDDSVSEKIRSDLASLATNVDELTTISRSVLDSSPSLNDVEDLIGATQPLINRLAALNVQLRRRAVILDVDKRSLNDAAKEWQLTANSEVLREAPVEVREQAARTLASVQTTQQQISLRQNAILSLQSSLSETVVKLDGLADEARSVESRLRSELFTVDQPPLWRVRSTPNPVVSHTTKHSIYASNWIETFEVQILLQIGLFLVSVVIVSAVLRVLQPRASLWEANPEPSVQALAHVVHRPISSSFFVAALISSLVITGLPRLVIGLGTLVLLIPTLRLLPKLLTDNFSSPFFLLVASMLADILLRLLSAESLAGRIGWLVLQLSMIGSLWWMRGALRQRDTSGLWSAVVRTLVVTGLVVSVGALIANVAGMLQLSEFVSRSLLRALFIAAVIRGLVVILTGFAIVFAQSNRLAFITSRIEAGAALHRKLERAVGVLGVIAFVIVVLTELTLWDPLVASVSLAMGTNLKLGALSITPYAIMLFTLMIFLSFIVSRVVQFGMEVSVYPRLRFQMGQANAISKILHYAVLFVGFLVAVSAAGVEFSKFAILAGGLSVGLGFGLQNVVNNFVSGLILLVERPIRVGDVISVGTTSGVVRDIGIRATHIRTAEGADVVYPNGELIAGQLTNWTRLDTHRRVDINVGAAYGSNPKQVMSLLAETAQCHDRVLPDPKPDALFTGFGDSSMNFTLRFWCDAANLVTVSSDMHSKINDAFEQAGIEIPFPQRDLNIRSMPASVQDSSSDK